MLPDIARPDVTSVLVVETPVAPVEPQEKPSGLISYNTYTSTDTTLIYTQWSTAADHAFLRDLTGVEPVEYKLYRGQARENPPVPGCLVVVSIEFDGPDAQRQKQWVDTVFDALADETSPHPGGISGYFHISTDGTRVLNYAEWTDEQAHRDALAQSGHGTVGTSSKWQKVGEFPGVRNSGFRRYPLAS